MFSNDQTKSLFTLWKLGLINKSEYRFCCCFATFGSYLFHLIVLLKSDFNFSSSLVLSWVDEITTGTYWFVSVIVNVGSWQAIGLSIIKHLLDQVRKN